MNVEKANVQIQILLINAFLVFENDIRLDKNISHLLYFFTTNIKLSF